MRVGVRPKPWMALALSGLAVAGLALAAGGPRIRFGETTHDFGELASDTKVAHEWVFYNDGDAPLQILRTRSSCGCTMSVADDEPVAPGSRGTIHVEFDPAGLVGPIERTLAVDTNDPLSGVVRLTVKAHVTPVGLPTGSSGHPPIAGQSLLMGSCAACHAEPAAGRTGGDLYRAVCAMCHGERATGGRAPSLRHPSYLDARDDRELADGIAYGTANPSMPGFSELMGGPLSRQQIDSLVELLREWGSTTGTHEAAAAPDDG